MRSVPTSAMVVLLTAAVPSGAKYVVKKAPLAFRPLLVVPTISFLILSLVKRSPVPVVGGD
jgi:hypothetical protein